MYKVPIIFANIILAVLLLGCQRTPAATQPAVNALPTAAQTTAAERSEEQPIVVQRLDIATLPAEQIVQIDTPLPAVNLALVPNNWPGIERWLPTAWQAGYQVSDVRKQLSSAGWLMPYTAAATDFSPQGVASADINGDGLDEWLITLIIPGSQTHAPTIPYLRAFPGNFYVIGQEGILYRHFQPSIISAEFSAAPFLNSTDDLTGDGLPDILFDERSHNEFQHFGRYYFLTYHNGDLRDATSDDLLAVHQQPELSIDKASQSATLRYWQGDPDNLKTGFWVEESYRWDGGTLSRISDNG